MAAERVFGIAELFDSIMLHQDPIQLFTTQRVCRRWSAYIKRSKLLRMHMFLMSGPVTTLESEVKLNPCVAKIVKLVRNDSPSSSTSWTYRDASWRKMLLFRPALKGHRLAAHIWDVAGKHHVDSIPGDGMWRSITMEGLLHALERRMKAGDREKLLIDEVQRFTVSYVGWEDPMGQRPLDYLVEVSLVGV